MNGNVNIATEHLQLNLDVLFIKEHVERGVLILVVLIGAVSAIGVGDRVIIHQNVMLHAILMGMIYR